MAPRRWRWFPAESPRVPRGISYRLFRSVNGQFNSNNGLLIHLLQRQIRMVVSWTYYSRSEVQVSRSIEKVSPVKIRMAGKGITIGMQTTGKNGNDSNDSIWCYRPVSSSGGLALSFLFHCLFPVPCLENAVTWRQHIPQDSAITHLQTIHLNRTNRQIPTQSQFQSQHLTTHKRLSEENK